MKKKLSLFVCYVFFVVSLVHAENVGNAKKVNSTENAAVYYNKAFDLMKDYPDEINKKIQDVVANGWKSEDTDLENILTENEDALREFAKGLALEKCDFSYTNPNYNPVNKPMPNLLKVRTISNLVVLKGRKFEKDGNFASAIEKYLSLVTFAYHISQGNYVEMIIGAGVDIIAFAPINQYLSRLDTKKEDCFKILVFLKEIRPKLSLSEDLIESEKNFAIYVINELYVKNSLQGIEQNRWRKLFSPGDYEKLKSFYEILGQQGRVLVDKYYDSLIKAAQTNLAEDWDDFEKKLNILKEECAGEKYGSFLDYLKKVNTDSSYASYDMADKTVKLMIRDLIENEVRGTDHFYLTDVISRILETSAAVRIYAFEKNVFPDTLDDLVPDYLKEMPRDPYSQMGLLYKKENDGFIVYSIGKDREDNGGDGNFDFITPTEKSGKDIVLRFSI